MLTNSPHHFEFGQRAVITDSPIRELIGLKCTVVEFYVSFYTVRLDPPLLGISDWNVSLTGLTPENNGNHATQE